MQLKRLWKPLVFAAVVALPLFHSCKKDAFLDKRPIYDTIKGEKKEMLDLTMAKRAIAAPINTIRNDTCVLPTKHPTMVDVKTKD